MAAISSKTEAMISESTLSGLKLYDRSEVSRFSSVNRQSPPVDLPSGTTGISPSPPSQKLLDELAEASHRLETATPEAIIAWAANRYRPKLTMATAFGPEGCVILSMLAKIAPDTYVFNLDTGYQFPETLATRDALAEKYGI